jgi:hypothetical protein
VKTTCAEARCDRFPDAACRLIAEDDRRQHVLSAGTGPLGNGESGSGKGCTGVNDIAQVAVI